MMPRGPWSRKMSAISRAGRAMRVAEIENHLGIDKKIAA
jgi:hypothetical protein